MAESIISHRWLHFLLSRQRKLSFPTTDGASRSPNLCRHRIVHAGSPPSSIARAHPTASRLERSAGAVGGGRSPWQRLFPGLRWLYSPAQCSRMWPGRVHQGAFAGWERSFSPNRFTCEGFLLLLKGCMLGPDDFEFVSGLVFLAA